MKLFRNVEKWNEIRLKPNSFQLNYCSCASGSVGGTDGDIEEKYKKLVASNSKSLLKKYLTKEIFDRLKDKKTPIFGSTLLDCIQSGLEHHDSQIGVYAPDAEAYRTFAELFDPIIKDYHLGFRKTSKHPRKHFGDGTLACALDPNNEFIVSTRVRASRSLKGYPFNSRLEECQYEEIELKVSKVLLQMGCEFKGEYHPLCGMEESVKQKLIKDHFLFKEGDRFLEAAQANRFWPKGRGIFFNEDKTFLVWCNEEDHIRFISMEQGGNLGSVYRRLVRAITTLEQCLEFNHDNRLGFLTFCPSDLGSAIRASVLIRLQKLAGDVTNLEKLAKKYHLQIRGTYGEHTEAEGGIYDISNKRRLGISELQAIQEMQNGIIHMIKIEKNVFNPKRFQKSKKPYKSS